jgi:D-lyxose ketol-isomerase
MLGGTMKRSTVNQIMREADAFIRSHGYILPPFAYWSPDFFKQMKRQAKAIIDAKLGWDITDYGVGNFATDGLFLFTVRNGHVSNLKAGTGVVYAEKAMISRKNQISPNHRHDIKTEDIINRGGGVLAIELFMADDKGGIDRKADVRVMTDGMERVLPAGGILRLDPGESVTLEPKHWHKFWGEKADVFIGEVSTVNDDVTDNIFERPIGRFAAIEEDEPPLHLLVSDYDRWLT